MGRRTYLACSGDEWEKARMRALVRDEFRCQHPGCSESNLRLLEVHHIRQRVHGGTHELENLVTLCRLHHAVLHPHLRRILGREASELDAFPYREL